MPARHLIQFPPAQGHDLSQAEAYFYVIEKGERIQLRFHDYDDIFSRPGLYEQLFYDRLKCTSPQKVCEILQSSLAAERKSCTELRVLDLGAGNGMMAEAIRRVGAARVVGVDIIPEAREAAYRDRPAAYDDYWVQDFTALTAAQREELREWNFDCLTSVAALGFGDIPPAAFFEALRLIPDGGWVAFNIKETFLDHNDDTGFSRFVRELIFSKHLQVCRLERYVHRVSMEGVPLYYYALVGRVTTQVPEGFLAQTGVA